MKYTLWFDGASRGNGISAGAGCLIEGNENHIELYTGLGRQTNNYAEYSGVLLGLKHIVENESSFANMKQLDVKGDSQLVIRQLEEKWKIKSENLKHLYDDCRSILEVLQNKGVKITYLYIPRKQNTIADRLANLGADMN